MRAPGLRSFEIAVVEPSTPDCSTYTAEISKTVSGTYFAGWTGPEDGAGDELERAQVSPASGIGHLRAVGGAAGEPKGAEVHSACHTVTRVGDGAQERGRPPSPIPMFKERALGIIFWPVRSRAARWGSQ
jgi:hypothetical protein